MEDVRIDVPAKAPFEVWLAGALMVAVMGLGSWQAVQSLADPALADVPSGLAEIRTGVASEKFSKHLDNHLPARSALIAAANAGRYLIFQGAGDSVRLGRDEWLFSVEELAYSPQSMAQLNKRVSKVVSLSAALAKRDVTLVVALVPDKARVHERQLSNGQYPHWLANRYPTALQGLRAGGVHTVDLLRVMAPASTQHLFYATDTHWNQDGADLAAKTIAAQVHATVPDLPPTQFATTAADRQTVRVGDLLRLMVWPTCPIGCAPIPTRRLFAKPRAPARLHRVGCWTI
jgi:alginate O-acetyltransferase complex protein AlgJ